jgi:hypothetical protein
MKGAVRQQETFQQMMQESMRSYVQLLNTLHFAHG